jgi:alpha-glucosidase
MIDVIDNEGNSWESRLRNVYALGMAEAVFSGLRRAFPKARPFILTRSGFAGYQRYAAMWTGETSFNCSKSAMVLPTLMVLV